VEITAPPERLVEVTQNIRRAMAGEHLRDQETVRLAKDGRRIDVSLTISPIHDGDGKVVGMSTVARDITDRKRAEERDRALSRALEEARDTLELLTIGAADGITIQDAKGEVVYANLAAALMSGYGSVNEFLAADPRERLAHWVMLREDGEPFPVDELPGRRVLAGKPEAEAVLRVRDRRDGSGEPGIHARPVGEIDEQHRTDHLAGLRQHRSSHQHVPAVDERLDRLEMSRSRPLPPLRCAFVGAVPCDHHELHVLLLARREGSSYPPQAAWPTGRRGCERR
jgi:PAS domain-containing protein